MVWRKGKRVRFHLADNGVVLEHSVEGVLLACRAGFYVLTDATVLSRVEETDGTIHVQETVVAGEYEVPRAKVVGREVRR